MTDYFIVSFYFPEITQTPDVNQCDPIVNIKKPTTLKLRSPYHIPNTPSPELETSILRSPFSLPSTPSPELDKRAEYFKSRLAYSAMCNDRSFYNYLLPSPTMPCHLSMAGSISPLQMLPFRQDELASPCSPITPMTPLTSPGQITHDAYGQLSQVFDRAQPQDLRSHKRKKDEKPTTLNVEQNTVERKTNMPKINRVSK